MYSHKISRAEFATMLMEWKPGNERVSYHQSGEPEVPPQNEEVWVCWADQKNQADELPRLVIVPDDTLSDFFAWAITFLPAYRPLTSFIRVLPWSIFSEARIRTIPTGSANRSVLVGLILGETLTNAVGRGFIDSLPLTAYESTYSYAAGRAIALGFGEPVMSHIFRSWQSVREIGDQHGRRLFPGLLQGVWEVGRTIVRDVKNSAELFGGDGRTIELARACQEIAERGQISISTMESLSRGRIQPHWFGDAMMRLPREQRVVAFERSIKELSFGPPDDFGPSFLVGYLASLVSDGSLEHAHLVFPLQGQFPSAMLWYGICASLPPTNRVLSDYGHLGLRILRMLERKDDLLSPPACDISLAELQILLRGQPTSRAFRHAHASSLRVELAPGVTTLIRPVGNQSLPEQPGLFGEEPRQPKAESERLRELISTLKNTVALAESILSRTTGPNTGAPQSRRRKR